MIKCISLTTLLVLAFGLLNGCNESYESPYVREAKEKAEIKKIHNQAERDDAEHKILLSAVENNVMMVMPDYDVNLINANHNAVDYLLAKLPVELSKDSPILIASFVSLDDLSESSTFGRVVSEQIASRFKQRDYNTIELKLRTKVFIRKGEGEFLLSRELSDISNKHRAQAVVVGTYAVASTKVYVTVRVIKVVDSQILSSYDYAIPIDRDVFKMLLKGKNNFDWL